MHSLPTPGFSPEPLGLQFLAGGECPALGWGRQPWMPVQGCDCAGLMINSALQELWVMFGHQVFGHLCFDDLAGVVLEVWTLG